MFEPALERGGGSEVWIRDRARGRDQQLSRDFQSGVDANHRPHLLTGSAKKKS